jgi:hypothetical protein
MSMPRQPTTYQFDLFSQPNDAETAQTPQWQALPAETRRSVTKLMVRLILDHINSERAVQQEGTPNWRRRRTASDFAGKPRPG